MAHPDYLYKLFEIDSKGLYDNILKMLQDKDVQN